MKFYFQDSLIDNEKKIIISSLSNCKCVPKVNTWNTKWLNHFPWISFVTGVSTLSQYPLYNCISWYKWVLVYFNFIFNVKFDIH